MAYYNDDGDDQQPDDMPDKPDGMDEGKEQEMGGESTMVPASIFPTPVKPGDICDFKVVSVHGDEVEIEYAEDSDEPSAPDKHQRMAAMADKM